MAELLIRVVDKVNADPALDVRCTKRGDVIVVCEDGWPWGTEERRLPIYRLLSIPGVPATELQGLTAEQPARTADPAELRRRRHFGLDLDDARVTQAGLRDFFQGAREERQTLQGLPALLVSAITVERPRPDLGQVIGDDARVIG